MADSFNEWIVKFFAELSPDLDAIYETAKHRDLGSWQNSQTAQSAVAGGLWGVIPVLGYATIPLDFLTLMRKMTVTAYGCGAIIGHARMNENILEVEDFAVILASWCGAINLSDVATSKIMADLSAKAGTKAAAKLFAKLMCKQTGLLVGRVAGGRLGAKAGAKFGAKLGGKLATRWIPFVSAAVSSGINGVIIHQLGTHAEMWYRMKTDRMIEAQRNVQLT